MRELSWGELKTENARLADEVERLREALTWARKLAPEGAAWTIRIDALLSSAGPPQVPDTGSGSRSTSADEGASPQPAPGRRCTTFDTPQTIVANLGIVRCADPVCRVHGRHMHPVEDS